MMRALPSLLLVAAALTACDSAKPDAAPAEAAAKTVAEVLDKAPETKAPPRSAGEPTVAKVAKEDPADAPERQDATKASIDDGGDGDVPDVEPPAAPTPAAVVAEAGPGPGALRFDPPAGPGGVLPYEAMDDETGTAGPSSNWKFGWAKDGKTFAYCTYDASDEGGSCWAGKLGGKGESFVPEKWDDYEKKHGPIDRGAKTWPYGDITLTSSRVGPKLSVGGRAGPTGGKPDMYSSTVDEEYFFDNEGDLGIGFASVSPDGTEIAILEAAILGFVHEETKLQRTTTGAFAADVYAAHGFADLTAGEFEAAAKRFSQAAGADAAWKHPYNEACARARGKLSGAEAALKLAIERGGAKVKKKAKGDADLANVRSEAWFVALVGA